MKARQVKQNEAIEMVIDISSLEEYRSPSNKRIRLCRDRRSFIDGEGYWNVYPFGFSSAQVFVVCPHCGEIHIHGRGQEPEFLYEGHRVPQCLAHNNNGYIIKRGSDA